MKSFRFSILDIGLFIISIIFTACAREEDIPVKADFKIVVVNNDYSAPVVVKIINKSSGADTYEWSFKGANRTSSTEINPKPITYSESGIYKIKLNASNRDRNTDSKEIEIRVDPAIRVDFDWQREGSDIAPVKLKMNNKSIGASFYIWTFENGSPATSTEQNPTVIFTTEGNHKIKLTVSNSRESHSIEKEVNVKPAMIVDFDWLVDFVNSDYQAPVTVNFQNKSINAVSYVWNVSGTASLQSTETNPSFVFPIAGDYTISLKATNDKGTKIIQKQIKVFANKNLLNFKNIKLGISTAHSSIGSFFSSQLGKVLTKNEVTASNGEKIDFAFFGLDNRFTYNQIISPNEVQNTAFLPIPNAISTKIINSQELVGVQLNSSSFDAIEHGNAFNSLNIVESNRGKTPFTGLNTPRIILFQTQDGRKGAIKIKQFVSQGKESYILTDIKVQKKP